MGGYRADTSDLPQTEVEVMTLTAALNGRNLAVLSVKSLVLLAMECHAQGRLKHNKM